MASDPIVRPAGAEDVTALVSLVRSAYRGEASRAGWTSEADLLEGERIRAEDLGTAIGAPNSVVLVLADGAELLGCCQLRDAGGGGVAEFGMFAVDPRRQGAGLGRRLMAAACTEAARRFGADTLELTALEAQTALVAFYERLGFRATGETRGFGADPVRARPRVDGLRFVVMRAPVARPSYALSWSGGKDSALALRALTRDGPPPVALVTTVTEAYGRISMHGVRRELLAAQAAATGLELVEVTIPAGASNETYEARLAGALAAPPLDAVTELAYGDLFLADLRAYREAWCASVRRTARFPLWGRDTAALAREFIAAGFRATVVCLDPARLPARLAGRPFDERLLAELPAGVDPCGENGEFHTFVHDGPGFARPVACVPGEHIARDGFVFADLVPVPA